MEEEDFSDCSDSDEDEDYTPEEPEFEEGDIDSDGNDHDGEDIVPISSSTPVAKSKTKFSTFSRNRKRRRISPTIDKKQKKDQETKHSEDEEDSNDSCGTTEDDDDEHEKSSYNTRASRGNDIGSDDGEDQELEELDQERGDKLWNDFLSPTEKNDNKTEGKKMETKTYDFAGEKVTVIDSGKSHEKSWINKNQSYGSAGSYSRFGGQREYFNDKDYPRPRTNFLMLDSYGNAAARKRGGLSFLSGDPEQIGLSGPTTKGGLANVLAALQNAKKQNLGTLEKSRLDWEAFKKDEGIEDELQTQIKSKDGYLERQEFLQRSDMRAFEIEKSIRTKSRRHP